MKKIFGFMSLIAIMLISVSHAQAVESSPDKAKVEIFADHDVAVIVLDNVTAEFSAPFPTNVATYVVSYSSEGGLFDDVPIVSLKSSNLYKNSEHCQTFSHTSYDHSYNRLLHVLEHKCYANLESKCNSNSVDGVYVDTEKPVGWKA